jgi:hypothetical protein
MTDMITPKVPAAQATPAKASSTEVASSPKPTVVTLEDLAMEIKVAPRDARMLLRLAAKQTKQYPNLSKEHVARQPWQWTPGSKALDEARKALKATD